MTGADLAHAAAGRQTSAARLAELVALSARGHEDAFAELYDLTAPRIHGVVLRVLRSADHAAEVTQEVFVEVWRQAARYSAEKGSVMAWMTTMAHRRAVDHLLSAQPGERLSLVRVHPEDSRGAGR
jgi:RNA polymerase sigma-70 factor (ECF subfamily)